MSFLNLAALWIAAGVVPTLLILYFLKLRRKEESVPSTLLWKRAVQDLQVNAPFQKLRKNLLLLLQLLVLGAGVIALARPIVSGVESVEGRVVMLIDRSASMNAIEPDGRTRLEHAREQAIRRARTFNNRGSSWLSFRGVTPQTQIMVVSFADQASVLQPFTTNVNEVVAAIESIQPTDAPTDIREALQLAQAYMSAPAMITQGMEDTPVPAESPATILLFSDGRINAAGDAQPPPGHTLQWIRVGQATDNVGITAFRVRRAYENPEQLLAYVEIRNFSNDPVETDVSIFLNGALLDAKAVKLDPAGTPLAEGEDPATQPAAGRMTEAVASLSFERPVPDSGTLEVRISRADALMTDNVAYAVLPPPRKLRVLLVTEKNWMLQTVLDGLPIEKVETTTPAAYETAVETQFSRDGQSLYDVVVMDKHTTAKLPMGNYLFLGAAPQIPGVEVGETVEDYRLIWWDESHPVLRYVGLDYVLVDSGVRLKFPENSEILMESSAGASLGHVLHEGRHYLILGFALEKSDLPRKLGFPVLIYNAIRYLGSGGAAESDEVRRPGVTLRTSLPAGKNEGHMLSPGGRTEKVKADNAGVVRFAGTQQVGLYELRTGNDIVERFAVNLEDPEESRIAPPAGELRLGGGAPIAQAELIQASTPEVWRWFVGAALVVAMIEWWIYNRRVLI
jgi:hypothetical protein